MITIRSIVIALAAALSTGIFAGEVTPPDKPPVVPPPANGETPKPPVNPPVTPPKPPPPNPNNPANEVTQLINDLLAGDAAKRDAVGKTLIDKGAMAYYRLTLLLNNADKDVVKRATDIRKQIEQRSMQMMQDANAQQEKMQQAPLTPQAIEEVRKAWLGVFQYAPQNELRQFAQQSIQATQAMNKDLDAATKALKDSDAALAAKPEPAGIARAALLVSRAQLFLTLQRFDEALKTAKDAFAAGGRESRFAPSLLKMEAELSQRKQDTAAVEAACKKIISDYPDSLEAKSAFAALIDLYIEKKRWDEAVETAKNVINACPLDEEVQEKVDSLLDDLFEHARDYPRAYGLATWLKGKLPVSRTRQETLQILARCSEYAVKDFAKAEAAYKSLSEIYADVFKHDDADALIKRIKAKAEGKFPKEPKNGDEGPTGAFGQFLEAVRAKDAKKLAAVLPELEAPDAEEKLNGEDSELVSIVTFADYIVKNVKPDAESAELTIDYYDSASAAPKTIVERASKEKGVWKIDWTDPEDLLNPPAKAQNGQKPQKAPKATEQK